MDPLITVHRKWDFFFLPGWNNEVVMSNISRLVHQPSWDSSVPLLDRLEAYLPPLSVSGISVSFEDSEQMECQQIRVVPVLISSPKTRF